MSEQNLMMDLLNKVTTELVSSLFKNEPLDQHKMSLLAALSSLTNSQPTQQHLQRGLPVQSAIQVPNMSPNWIPITTTPSTSGMLGSNVGWLPTVLQSSVLVQNPAITASIPTAPTALHQPFYPNPSYFTSFATQTFAPFVGFRSRYEEAVAHTRSCGLYTRKWVMDTAYQYLFNPHGSKHLPQKVQKSSPTAKTLFKRWLEKDGYCNEDIEKMYDGMEKTAMREWGELAKLLRRERKNQVEKKYIVFC